MSHGPSLAGCGAAVAAALALAGAPGLATAQDRLSPPPPPVPGLHTVSVATRYATPDGAVRFVLDRSGGRAALVRFEGDPEVHVLRPVMAAGGGEIYSTEDGTIRLRVAPSGSITVYTRRLSTGAAASEEGRAPPLTPEIIAIAEMQERFRRLQIRAQRSLGEPVQFIVPAQMPAPVAGLVLDAAERATEGLAAAPLTNVRRVRIVLGPAPAAIQQGDMLIIQVAPHMGYEGRPSSIAIRNVVSGAVQGPEQ